MLSVWTMLMLNGLLFSLRVTGREGSFPRPLSRQEEEDCLTRLAQGDSSARDTLIEHNLRLVAHIVKKYFVQTDEQDDLISIGTIGLIKAINTYRPDKGIKLATYAARCIENEILMYLRKTKKRAGELSLSETLDDDPDGGSISLLDVIPSDEDMTEVLDTRDACRQLRRFVKTVLTEREQEVISLRYGLTGLPPMTQREVASRCGISRSYISRIEKKALQKLGAALDA
jgi:RNA polymerase sporulation-specific sigma factor